MLARRSFSGVGDLAELLLSAPVVSLPSERRSAGRALIRSYRYSASIKVIAVSKMSKALS